METAGSQRVGSSLAGLSQAEAFARIRLLRSPNIGPVSYRQLLARFGSATAAIEALPDLGSRGRGAYRPAPAEAIEREIAAVRKAGARYLFHDQPDYPALLAELESAPPILTCRGHLPWQARHAWPWWARAMPALLRSSWPAILPPGWLKLVLQWFLALPAALMALRMKAPCPELLA